MARNKLRKNFSAILIHDGDFAPDVPNLLPKLDYANFVYSANLVGGVRTRKALPIGLENA